MSYPINEIFYSLQGEGFWAGRPAAFVRFSGCDLSCPFCDTDHAHFQDMGALSILKALGEYTTDFVVLTGGEPSLYVDDKLVSLLHEAGKTVAIETNGTHKLPENIDWITLSPKDCYSKNAKVILEHADELKLVFDAEYVETIECYSSFNAKYFYLQPCDTGNIERNRVITAATVDYCLTHPQWSLSLQQQKILNIR